MLEVSAINGICFACFVLAAVTGFRQSFRNEYYHLQTHWI